MLAGRAMSGWTIALSLISGCTSGISYLGMPGYILEDGVGQATIFLCWLVVIPVGSIVSMCTPALAALGKLHSQCFFTFLVRLTVQVIIPFYHDLGLTTAYTYFEHRFDKPHRTIAACLFLARVNLYLAVVLFAPALLLHTVLEFPLWATILFTGCMSTLWTIKGGMLAVVYTDAVQSVAMIAGVVSCLGFTLAKIDGGPAAAYRLLGDGGMLQWKELVEFHPTRREAPAESVWAMLLGVGTLSLAQVGTDQLAVQRFLTAKNKSECIKSFVYSGVYNIFWVLLMCINALAILSFYEQEKIRPVQDKLIEQADQILPYFAITQVNTCGIAAHGYRCRPSRFLIESCCMQLPRGIAGLLVAAVLGSTMSVYSGGLNAAATCCHVDILTNALGQPCPAEGEVAPAMGAAGM